MRMIKKTRNAMCAMLGPEILTGIRNVICICIFLQPNVIIILVISGFTGLADRFHNNQFAETTPFPIRLTLA